MTSVPPLPERHRHVRGEAEQLQDLVVPIVAARLAQELVGHVVAPPRPSAPHDLDHRVQALGIGRVHRAQLLGERALFGVGVPRGHAPDRAVLLGDVDDAQVGEHGDRDLGQPLDHVAVVEDLGEHLCGEEEELVAPPLLEELVQQPFALGHLGRGVQQLAQVPADGVHQLDDREVVLAWPGAQHLDDPDARAAVADRERVRGSAARAEPGSRRRSARRAPGPAPRSARRAPSPSGQPVAPAGRVGRLSPGRTRGRRLRRASRHGGRPASPARSGSTAW